MHADVLNYLTAAYGHRVTARSTWGHPLTHLSHHINHYSEAARILTTGPRQHANRHATAELFHSTTSGPDDYTHFARTLTHNTELRRLPRGYATPDTHPHAECIGLYLHGHLIITWSCISRTRTNQTTSVHYHFGHGFAYTTTTNARLNRFGPSNVRTHQNKGQLWITTGMHSSNGDGHAYRYDGESRMCVAVNDYYSDELD